MTGKPTKLVTDTPTNLEHVMGRRSGEDARPDDASSCGETVPRRKQIVHDDLGLRIDRDGVWYYHGSPITRKELVCLFASVLSCDENGRYWLTTPAEIGEIMVEDAPFIAVEVFANGEARNQIISVRTNIDQIVTLDETHPLFVEFDMATGEPSPYVRTDGNLTARLSRSVYYQLVELGTEREIDDKRVLGVWSCGVFFVLGALEET